MVKPDIIYTQVTLKESAGLIYICVFGCIPIIKMHNHLGKERHRRDWGKEAYEGLTRGQGRREVI